MPAFVDVILPLPLKRQYTYSLSEEELEQLSEGYRVAVPFGKSKLYTGIVYHIHQNPPHAYEAKPIHAILDTVPTIYAAQIRFWDWIASYYMCTVGEVMRAALPSGLMLGSDTTILMAEGAEVEEAELTDEEYAIVEALDSQSQLSIEEVSQILNKKRVLPLMQAMVDKGILEIREQLQQKFKPKLLRYVKLHPSYQSDERLRELLDLLSRAPKQREAVLTLFQLKGNLEPVKVKALLEQAQISTATVKTLIDKQILEELFLETSRLRHSAELTQAAAVLSGEQRRAVDEIELGFSQDKITLLHGVTSSGKTEVYADLIAGFLEKKEQVLYLVPEIALTTQLVKRLDQRFGGQVLVYHSRYSSNERVEVWHNMTSEVHDVQVVIGARSSLFLPWTNLGLIIIDEEHEVSYKQFNPSPRYHARDAAIMLGKHFGAKVLLGSATPSLESYYHTQTGKYHLVEMTRRYNEVMMPEIELVDLADKYKRKRMKGHFSDRLIDEIQTALKENFQVILFQNRRGYSPILQCTSCGHSPQCPSCDVSLTYHQNRHQLRCHYCGFSKPKMTNCDACGNPTLDTKGFGTEQIEEEVKQLFPAARVARMDLDTTRGKYSFNRLIDRFEDSELDILVGTQMVTKGLDFKRVKLVGVLNADNLLNFPDFRSHERCYQLLSQVAGRSGRSDVRGKVVIQTYNPHHRILQQVSINDYGTMFKEQLQDRYQYHYPPYYRIVKISLRHRDIQRVNMGAEWFAKALRAILQSGVLGPEYPLVARIRNQYHKNIMVKIGPGQSLAKTKEAILKVENSFFSIKGFNAVRVVMNVDSY